MHFQLDLKDSTGVVYALGPTICWVVACYYLDTSTLCCRRKVRRIIVSVQRGLPPTLEEPPWNDIELLIS